MDIYIDRIKHARFPNRRKAKGKLFNRLIGVNVATPGKTVTIEPIYMATLQYERIGKVVIININPGKPWLAIVLMPKWPFVVVVEEDKIVLEDE